MKFGANRSQLYDAQKTARAKWEAAAETWNDASRRDFEEHVWEPLDAQTAAVLRAIDQLSALFTQVRQDCEFNP
jgi:hypothetical protein